MSENDTKCTCFGNAGLMHSCPICGPRIREHAIWAQQTPPHVLAMAERNAAPQPSNPPAGAAKRPKLTMQEARELSADIARRAEERRKAAVALECTPPPQQPGGTPEDTPETDAKWNAIVDDENTSQTIGGTKWKAVAIRLCEEMRTLETQRNEARWQLSAVGVALGFRPDEDFSHSEGLPAIVKAVVADKHEAEGERNEARAALAAALAETRKLREKLGQVSVLELHYKEATESAERALTAAEQRADGAEKERESCHQLFDQVIALCGFTKGGGYPGIVGSVEHLAGQRDDAREERDTALRERDEAKTEVEELRDAREATAGRHGGEILRLNTNHSHRIAAINAAIDGFEQKERGIPQAHMAAKLTAELRAALAAKTTEGGV